MNDYYKNGGDEDERDAISEDSEPPVIRNENRRPKEPRKEKKIAKRANKNRNDRKEPPVEIY